MILSLSSETKQPTRCCERISNLFVLKSFRKKKQRQKNELNAKGKKAAQEIENQASNRRRRRLKRQLNASIKMLCYEWASCFAWDSIWWWRRGEASATIDEMRKTPRQRQNLSLDRIRAKSIVRLLDSFAISIQCNQPCNIFFSICIQLFNACHLNVKSIQLENICRNFS